MSAMPMPPAQALSQLLRALVPVPAPAERQIQGLSLDSRKVKQGDLFVAMAGDADDGRRYIAQAIAAGAVAVAYEVSAAEDESVTIDADGVVHLAVSGVRAKLGVLAERFYGMPTQT